jgi:hypothetical protein
MNLSFSARSIKQEDEQYKSLADHNLESSFKIISGDGSPGTPYMAKIRLTNIGTETWKGVVHIELPIPNNNPRFFLPAFMYGRNRGESPQNVPNEFPRMRKGELKRPSSSWWMVRADRLSHPVALAYDAGRITGLSGSPYFIRDNEKKCSWEPDKSGQFYQYAGYTCSLEKGSVGYTIGYENAPWLFVSSHNVFPRSPLKENCFEIRQGETINFDLCIFDFRDACELGINQAVKFIYDKYHQTPRKGSAFKETVEDISLAVFNDAWLESEKSYSGQVFEERSGYRYNKIFSLTWTNGLSVSVPMLLAGLRLDNEPMRCQAIKSIDYILGNCMNPASGLPYDALNDGEWSTRGWWFDGMHTGGHSSYLTGQALFYILKAYEYEKRLGNRIHDEWMDFVKPIISRIERTRNADQEYPYVFSEKTGSGLEYDSFAGCWCMASSCYHAWLSGDTSNIEKIRKSESHYYDDFVAHMECYGTPLDTDKAVDSEGILAYIKALKFLHLMTHDEVYLDHMRDAFDYEFTFKFCYNSPVKVPPLGRLGWSSSGGSVTSTANPHIHPMSNNIIDEYLYYLNIRRDDYLESRLTDTIKWGCQTYNRKDLEFDYGKKGWMSERFCYSEGLLTEHYEDGSIAGTWFCLMPWASACIIEGLCGDYWDKFK